MISYRLLTTTVPTMATGHCAPAGNTPYTEVSPYTVAGVGHAIVYHWVYMGPCSLFYFIKAKFQASLLRLRAKNHKVKS